MSTALTTVNNGIALWEDTNKLSEIRKLFAPKLTEMEFQYFVGLGKAAGLNPFLREIWSVKYDEKSPAQVFIGRDGYRKAAQAHSEYDYHQSDAVYENDVFEVQDGLVKHSYKLTARGALIGAYCIAKRHKSSRPIYVFAELKEYSTGKSIWGTKPATMIKKVAESQCLRACFQDLLGGTYGEEEMSNVQMENNNMRVINGETQTERLKSLLNNNTASVPIPTVITQNEMNELEDKNKLATDEQILQIEVLMDEKGFDEQKKKNAYDYFKIKSLSELTNEKAEKFLMLLEKK